MAPAEMAFLRRVRLPARPGRVSRATAASTPTKPSFFSESPSRILVEVKPEERERLPQGHFGKGQVRVCARRRPDHGQPDPQGHRPGRLDILEEPEGAQGRWQNTCPEARMKNPQVLILRAAGTNCDLETANAFKPSGGTPELVHIPELRRQEAS